MPDEAGAMEATGEGINLMIDGFIAARKAANITQVELGQS